MRKAPIAAVALTMALGLVLGGCASDETAAPAAPATSAGAMEPDQPMASDEAMDPGAPSQTESDMAKETDMATEGSWVDQAAYDADPAAFHAAGDVVLFFNASWCPTCRAAVQSLDADGVPTGLTVVSVDYDSSSDLKRTYGVTVQHTFVQVDESGNQLTKFTGSTSGADIAAKTV